MWCFPGFRISDIFAISISVGNGSSLRTLLNSLAILEINSPAIFFVIEGCEAIRAEALEVFKEVMIVEISSYVQGAFRDCNCSSFILGSGRVSSHDLGEVALGCLGSASRF